MSKKLEISNSHILGSIKNGEKLTVVFRITQFVYCWIMRIIFQTQLNQIFKMLAVHGSPPENVSALPAKFYKYSFFFTTRNMSVSSEDFVVLPDG